MSRSGKMAWARMGESVKIVRRRKEIMELLLDRGRLSVDELIRHFQVTGMTIRRDLDTLEQEGYLARTHGGCIPRTPHVSETPFREKELQQNEEKQVIARAAVLRIPDGVSLYLDTGTTCVKVARLLRTHRRNLRVFTNNLPAALELFAAESIETVVPGGTLGHRSPDLTGSYGTDRLADWRFDLAVVGADALDAELGELYSAEGPTAALSQQAQERAVRTLACIDSSKFGKRATAVSGRLEAGVTLFTDAKAPPAALRHAERHGAEVFTADLSG